jgi:uncharacterized membrane protein (UPF0127 family)
VAATQQERFAGLPSRTLGDGRVLVQASTHRARRRGLSRIEPMDDDHALHIPRCPSVHTFGMRFALDLIWLRRDGSVARVDRDVGPRRMRMCLRAGSVIETVAGQADAFLAADVATAAHAGMGGDATKYG